MALLVHPKQPLSYLERLIQSELPSIKDEKGDKKIPNVHFKAEDYYQDETQPKAKSTEDEGKRARAREHEEVHPGEIEATEKPGILKNKDDDKSSQGLGDGGVESYSGLGREGSTTDMKERRFIRWSPSTETGDFIRDAARGKEFLVEIDGAAEEIPVAVPSFNDRTYYLRTRLRKTSSEILKMAELKRECDIAAHKGAQQIAMGGAGLLVGYWYIVYRLTFETELGWDTMEPVTVQKLPIIPLQAIAKFLVVPRWAFDTNLWLSLVSVPQSRGIIPFCLKSYDQPKTNEAVPIQRVRSSEVGILNRRGQCIEKGDQGSSSGVRCRLG